MVAPRGTVANGHRKAGSTGAWNAQASPSTPTHNINVNCILPGLIATEELTALGIIPPAVDKEGNAVPRLHLTPSTENVADLALFLASSASDGMTGELFPIRRWLRSERFWT